MPMTQLQRHSAQEIADFLDTEGFDVGSVHGSNKDHAQVTFIINGLTGVNIPWLHEAMNVRGWHIEKVENTGTTSITVESGTDPFVPE